jgi:hypothetical protein
MSRVDIYIETYIGYWCDTNIRGSENVRELAMPWRFSLTQTYDPVENPTGLISFGMKR